MLRIAIHHRPPHTQSYHLSHIGKAPCASNHKNVCNLGAFLSPNLFQNDLTILFYQNPSVQHRLPCFHLVPKQLAEICRRAAEQVDSSLIPYHHNDLPHGWIKFELMHCLGLPPATTNPQVALCVLAGLWSVRAHCPPCQGFAVSATTHFPQGVP